MKARNPGNRLLLGSWLIALVVIGCGSSLVGLECQAELSECDGRCVDVNTDPDNCGGCGVQCSAGESCDQGSCSSAGRTDGGVDGSAGDGGTDEDGSTDGGDGDANTGGDAATDGGGDAAADGGGSLPDVVLPELCTGPDSADDCVCDLGQLNCNKTCYDGIRDPDHCGACDVACGVSEYCVQGSCVLTCDAPLEKCNNRCIDTSDDPDNCGGCGIRCQSGLCVDGACMDATVGHVIVVGHDMSSARQAIRRVAGNAIFLRTGNPLRVLRFEERTTAAAKAGIQSAIESMELGTGRQAQQSVASSLAVTFLLSQTDVFVIAAQASANDSVLQKNGAAWSKALATFLKTGGVVVLFDGGGTNAGTYQILQSAALFSARSRVALSTRTLDLVAPGDAVASGVPVVYQSEGRTVGFDTDESGVVVRDLQTGLPVVLHLTR